MTFEEKLEKYNYVKFINEGEGVCSVYIKGKCYKYRYESKGIWIKDEINGNYRFSANADKKRFIFVTDKYAEKNLSTQG